MLDELTIQSTSIRLFLDLIDVYESKGIFIPAEERPLVRNAITELIKIVGNHYDDKN